MSEAPQAGAEAPDFRLPDSDGAMRSLAQLAPCVLVFYRGHW